MTGIKRYLLLALPGLLLLCSIIPAGAAHDSSTCPLSWEQYSICRNNPPACAFPHWFPKCKANLYAQAGNVIPQQYSSQAAVNAYSSKYAEGWLKKQPNPGTWANAEMIKARKLQQNSSGSNNAPGDYVTSGAPSGAAGADLEFAGIPRELMPGKGGADKSPSKYTRPGESGRIKDETDLLPLCILAEPGSRAEYSLVPARNKDYTLKLDLKGQPVYTKIPFIAPDTRPSLDETLISYKGQSAFASVTAIGRDLLHEGSTTGPTLPEAAEAGKILLEIYKCSKEPDRGGDCAKYAGYAINRLGLIGTMLIAHNEKKVSLAILQEFLRTFSTDAQRDNRIKAAVVLGMMGTVAPGSDLSISIGSLLMNKAVNKLGDKVTINWAGWNGSFPVTMINSGLRGLEDDYNVRVAALLAIASIGSKSAVNGLAQIPQYININGFNGCNSCKARYYTCSPAYNKRANKAKDSAANDGATQCMAVKVLSGFVENSSNPQYGFALQKMKDLATEEMCEPSPQHPYYSDARRIDNTIIHATMALSPKGLINPHCLVPIAKAVTFWDGNSVTGLPCDIVDAAKKEVQDQTKWHTIRMSCQKTVLWNEAIEIVKGVAVGLVFAPATEASIVAVANNFRRTALALKALDKGINVFDTTKDIVKLGRIGRELTPGPANEE